MSKRDACLFLRRYLAACLAFLLCIGGVYEVMRGEPLQLDLTVGTEEADPQPVIVLDAGHGGEDCGAVGVNGVYEKDLNLALANLLAAQLRAAGHQVVLTRTDDRLLYDPATVEKGHKKSTDLASRAQIANSYEGAVLVSIHMNSFPQEGVHGLQVWYGAKDEEGAALARAIQEKCNTYLQAENKKTAKASTGNMYLLDRTEVPSVLVECGFLTNYRECTLLCDPGYQKELSLVLFSAILEYLTPGV